jgi:hemoglobin-like flavoprotein
MTDADLERFHDSLTRCLSVAGFLQSFYDRFLNSSPEIAVRFRHTDFVKQQRILQASLHMTILAAHGAPEAEAHLRRLATRHSRHELDIPAPLYRVWLDCLIETVRATDPRFEPELDGIWREMMEPGIKLMIAAYDRPPAVDR